MENNQIDKLEYDLLLQAYTEKCQECVKLQILATKLSMQLAELQKEDTASDGKSEE